MRLREISSKVWLRAISTLGVSAVAGTTLWQSGYWLKELALRIGTPPGMELTLPIAVDAGGIVAGIIWATSPDTRVRRMARAIATGALAFSVVGNALSHLLREKILEPGWFLIVTVGAVYPVMLYLIVHLFVSTSAESRRAANQAAKSKAKGQAPQPPKVTVSDEPTPTQGPINGSTLSKRELGREYFIKQVVDHGRSPEEITAAEIDRAIGATQYSKKHMPQWRDELTQVGELENV